MLNSWPLGFYQPDQLVGDARNHGVEVRPVDINYSEWDNKLEEIAGKYRALRLGFREVTGVKEDEIKILVLHRRKGYRTIQQLRDAGIPNSTLELLAKADAYRSMGLDRREALWHVSTKDHLDHSLHNEEQVHGDVEKDIKLPGMRLSEHVVEDYAATSLSLKAHPVSFLRTQLNQFGIITNAGLASMKTGAYVKVAGLIRVRQRPGTASGTCFITIEDEAGVSNVIAFKQMFNKYRKEIIQSKLIMVEDQLQVEGEVIHVIVMKCHNFSRLLGLLTAADQELISLRYSRADEKSSPFLDKKRGEDVTQGKIFPESRNFR